MSTLTDEHWRAAYQRARTLSGARLKTWWDRYIRVREHYEQHNSYDNIQKSIKIWGSWASQVSKNKKAGKLSREQIVALKEISFPYELNARGPKAGTGKKLDKILRLKDAFDTGKILPKPEDLRFLEKRIQFYANSYGQGSLSETAAQKLGIVIS